MSRKKVKYTLSNWDLVSVNPNYKVWNWKDLFCYWAVNIQSVIAFSLIASLYIVYDLNTFVVFFWDSYWFFVGIFSLKFNWKTLSKIWFAIRCFS